MERTLFDSIEKNKWMNIDLLTCGFTQGFDLEQIINQLNNNTKICTKLGKKIADNLIKDVSNHIFNVNEQFIVELIVNGFDAQLQDKSTGKFGVGFFSALIPLIQYNDIEMNISTNHEGLKYTIGISYSNEQFSFKVNYLSAEMESKLTDNGTIIHYKLKDSSFSINEIRSLHEEIKRLLYYDLGALYVTYNDSPHEEYSLMTELNHEVSTYSKYFINSKPQQFNDFNPPDTTYPIVNVEIGYKEITIEDKGSGIPLSIVLTKLLVPSSSTKEIKIEPIIFNTDNVTRVRQSPDEKGKLYILVNKVGVVKMEYSTEKERPQVFIIDLPHTFNLPVARNDVILSKDDNSLNIFFMHLDIIIDQLIEKTKDISILEEAITEYKKIGTQTSAFYYINEHMINKFNEIFADDTLYIPIPVNKSFIKNIIRNGITVNNFHFTKLTKEIRKNDLIDKIILFKKIMHIPGLETAESFREFIFSGILPDSSNITNFFNHLNKSSTVIYESAINLDTNAIEVDLDITSIDKLYMPSGFGTAAGYRSFLYLHFLYNYPELNLIQITLYKIKEICDRINRIIYEKRIDHIYIKSLTNVFNFIFHKVLFGNKIDEIVIDKLIDSFEESLNRDYVLNNTIIPYGFEPIRSAVTVTRSNFFNDIVVKDTLQSDDILAPNIMVNKFLYITKLLNIDNEIHKSSLENINLFKGMLMNMSEEYNNKLMSGFSETYSLNDQEKKTFDYIDFVKTYPISNNTVSLEEFKNNYINIYNTIKSTNSIKMFHDLEQRIKKLKKIYLHYDLTKPIELSDSFTKLKSFTHSYLNELSTELIDNEIAIKEMLRPIVLAWKQSYDMNYYGKPLRRAILKIIRNNKGKPDTLSFFLGSKLDEILTEVYNSNKYKLISSTIPYNIVINELFEEYHLVTIIKPEEVDPVQQSISTKREKRHTSKKRTQKRNIDRGNKELRNKEIIYEGEQFGGNKDELVEKIKLTHISSVITSIMKSLNMSTIVYNKSQINEFIDKIKFNIPTVNTQVVQIPISIVKIIHRFVYLYDLNIFMDKLTESINHYTELMNANGSFNLTHDLDKDPTTFNALVFVDDKVIERINLANFILELYIKAETGKQIINEEINDIVDYNTYIYKSRITHHNLVPSKLFNISSYPLINELENKMIENLKFTSTVDKGPMLIMQLYLLPRFFLNWLPKNDSVILNGISKIIELIKEENLEAWEYYVVGFIFACCFCFENKNLLMQKSDISFPQYKNEEFYTILSDTPIHKIVKFLPGIDLIDIRDFFDMLMVGSYNDNYNSADFLTKNEVGADINDICSTSLFNKFNMFFGLLLDSAILIPNYTDFETKKKELIGPITETSSSNTKLSQFIRQLYSDNEGRLEHILQNIKSDSPEIGLQIIKIAVNSGSPKQVEISAAIELLQNSIDASANKVPFRNWYSRINPYDIENINLFDKTCNKGVDLIITKTGTDPDNQIVFINRDYVGFSNLQQIIPLSVPYYSNKVSGIGQMGNGFFNAYRRTDKVYIYSKSKDVNFLIEDTPLKTGNIVTDINKNIHIYEKDLSKQDGTTVIIKFAKQSFAEMSHSLTNLVIEMQKLLNNIPYFNSQINNIKIEPQFKLFYSSYSLKIFVSKNMSSKAFVLTDGVPFSDFERFNKLNNIVPPNIESFAQGIIIDIQRNQLKPTQGRIDATFTPELLNELKSEILNVIVLKYYLQIYHNNVQSVFHHDYTPAFLPQLVPDGKIYNLTEYNDYHSFATRHPIPNLVRIGRKNNFNRLLTFIIRFKFSMHINGYDRRINLCSMANECTSLLSQFRFMRSFDISAPPNNFKYIIYDYNIVYDMLIKEEKKLKELFNKNNKKLVNFISLIALQYIKRFFDGFKVDVLEAINNKIDGPPITLDHEIFNGEYSEESFPGIILDALDDVDNVYDIDDLDDLDNLLYGNIPHNEQNDALYVYNPPTSLASYSGTLPDPSVQIPEYFTNNYIIDYIDNAMYIVIRSFVDTYIDIMISANVPGFAVNKPKPIVKIEYEESIMLGYYAGGINLLSLNLKALYEHSADFDNLYENIVKHKVNFISKIKSHIIYNKYFSPYNDSTVLHELEHYRREDGGHKRGVEPCSITGFHQSIISKFPNDKKHVERTFNECFIDTFKIAIDNDFINKWVSELVRLAEIRQIRAIIR